MRPKKKLKVVRGQVDDRVWFCTKPKMIVGGVHTNVSAAFAAIKKKNSGNSADKFIERSQNAGCIAKGV